MKFSFPEFVNWSLFLKQNEVVIETALELPFWPTEPGGAGRASGPAGETGLWWRSSPGSPGPSRCSVLAAPWFPAVHASRLL